MLRTLDDGSTLWLTPEVNCSMLVCYYLIPSHTCIFEVGRHRAFVAYELLVGILIAIILVRILPYCETNFVFIWPCLILPYGLTMPKYHISDTSDKIRSPPLPANYLTILPLQNMCTVANCLFLISLFRHLAQGISRVHLPPSATLECVVNNVLNRRMLRQHEGYAYRLEEWIDPESKPISEEAEASRKPLDLSMTIAEYTKNCGRTHFALIREHSAYYCSSFFL